MSQTKLEMRVEGMTCQGCVRTVQKKLMSVSGVTQARVDLEKAQASIDYDDSATNADTLIASVEQVGFHAQRA